MRGFVFTLIFTALFILLLYDASYYLTSRGSASLSIANQGGVDSGGVVMDDMGVDLLQYLDLGVQSSPLNASNRTNLTFPDQIPSTLASPGTEFTQWASFMVNDFPLQSNTNVTMNTTGFTAKPCIYALPYNLSYCYDSLNKAQLTVNGSSSVSNYSIVVRLNRAINATNDTNWTWSVGTTSLYVTLDMQDSRGVQLNVTNRTSGYVDPSAANYFVLMGTPSGNLTVEVGNVAGAGTSALRITPGSLSARLTTGVLLNGTPETTVFAPIWTTVGEQQSNLVLCRG